MRVVILVALLTALQGALASSANAAMLLVYLQPAELTNTQGQTSGNVTVLHTRDHHDYEEGDDTSVVTLKPQSGAYSGYRTYWLPNIIDKNTLTTWHLEANLHSPAASEQEWTWTLYDWVKQHWVWIGDNAEATPWRWTLYHFEISKPARFVGPNGEIRLGLVSSNDSN